MSFKKNITVAPVVFTLQNNKIYNQNSYRDYGNKVGKTFTIKQIFSILMPSALGIGTKNAMAVL